MKFYIEMFKFAKMQIACLAILLYIGIVYLREGNFFKRSQVQTGCSRLFNFLFILGELTIVFDAITAITVNNIDIISSDLNMFLHGCFFFLLQTFMFVFAIYSVKIASINHKCPLFKTCFVIPYITSVFLSIYHLPEIYYTIGKVTNYSDGFSAYVTFLNVAIYAIFSVMQLIVNGSCLERRKKTLFISWVIVSLIIVFLQVHFRETLLSSLGVAMILLAAFEHIETPSLKHMTNTYNEMIMGFSTLVESKDDSTGGHIKRTTNYVKIIIKSLQEQNIFTNVLTKDFINCLERAAPMHDIGKISIPDNILKKPGKLTDEEFAIMKTHAEKGRDIIENTFGHLSDDTYAVIARNVAAYHHEKWDGSGYPKVKNLKTDQMQGEEIPLEARIMAVADVFDAISTNRCYRDAMPLDLCFKIIQDGAGKSFDPIIVESFLRKRPEVEEYYYKMKD